MKRFYCTICKKVKRVRRYPTDIQNQYSDIPTNRVGTCARHSNSPKFIKLVKGGR